MWGRRVQPTGGGQEAGARNCSTAGWDGVVPRGILAALQMKDLLGDALKGQQGFSGLALASVAARVRLAIALWPGLAMSLQLSLSKGVLFAQPPYSPALPPSFCPLHSDFSLILFQGWGPPGHVPSLCVRCLSHVLPPAPSALGSQVADCVVTARLLHRVC